MSPSGFWLSPLPLSGFSGFWLSPLSPPLSGFWLSPFPLSGFSGSGFSGFSGVSPLPLSPPLLLSPLPLSGFSGSGFSGFSGVSPLPLPPFPLSGSGFSGFSGVSPLPLSPLSPVVYVSVTVGKSTEPVEYLESNTNICPSVALFLSIQACCAAFVIVNLYTDDLLANAESIIGHTLDSYTTKYDGLINSLQECYDVVRTNRAELESPTPEEGQEFSGEA